MKQKYVLPVILLCCFLQTSAQTDKTSNWVLPLHIDTRLVINAKSPAYDKYVYARYVFVPPAAKTLHLEIYAKAPKATDNLFNTSYAPFILQALTKKDKLLEKSFQGGTAKINITLKTADTIALFFLCTPPVNNDSINLSFDYTVGDTAELSYANKKPQEVFEKILELAATGHINMYSNDENNYVNKLHYPTGLFAMAAAERTVKKHIMFSGITTQYTGEKLNRQTADRNTADWNKKIKDWLSGYNVTDVKKTNKGDVKLNTDEEETVYTKKNARGTTLFVVTVFKEIVGEGTEADPVSYTTGVRISN